MDAGLFAARWSGRRLDVLAFAAGEGGDAGTANLSGDLADGVGSPWPAMVKPANDVDTQVRELVGHAKLFVMVHGTAGGLFAVAKGGVEETI